MTKQTEYETRKETGTEYETEKEAETKAEYPVIERCTEYEKPKKPSFTKGLPPYVQAQIHVEYELSQIYKQKEKIK
jgi:hypothetical protein